MIGKKILNNKTVVVKTSPLYPEFPYSEKSSLYFALLSLLKGLSLDVDNPFGEFIKPGDTVLIKPNWVLDYNFSGKGNDCLITHTSLIKYLMDFCIKALRGEGIIIIGDAPLQNCNFENLKKISRIEELKEEFEKKHPQLKILVEDWRLTKMEVKRMGRQIIFIRSQKIIEKKEEDLTEEYVKVDLGKESFLEEISDLSSFFRVANYPPSRMLSHHSLGKHEYLITKRVFQANFIINLAKMKTHVKTGITGAMKNLVGINAHKEYLPHHRKGSYLEGGDSYFYSNFFKRKLEDFEDWFWEGISSRPFFLNNLLKFFSKIFWYLAKITAREKIFTGNWQGNNTLWRTILDLNHIAYFSNQSTKILNIVDGIVAGEKEGPLHPFPKKAGILIGGWNPAYVDAVMAKLMGYNVFLVPTIYYGLCHRKSKFFSGWLEEMEIKWIEGGGQTKKRFEELPNLNFKKPKFWPYIVGKNRRNF